LPPTNTALGDAAVGSCIRRETDRSPVVVRAGGSMPPAAHQVLKGV
jgi:hypothetical protein